MYNLIMRSRILSINVFVITTDGKIKLFSYLRNCWSVSNIFSRYKCSRKSPWPTRVKSSVDTGQLPI